MKKISEKGMLIGAGAALSVSIALACASSVTNNPDGDAWFLAATGKMIMERGFLKENPFCVVDGLKLTIQSPLTCILNGVFDGLFGMSGLWILAMILNCFVLLCAFWAIRKEDASPFRKVLVLATLEFLLIRSGIVSTRPYQMTVATSFLAIAAWKREFDKGTRRAFFETLALQAALSVLQANVSSASLFYLYLWPMCFAVDFPPDPRGKKAAKWLEEVGRLVVRALKILLPAWLVTFAASMLNPYGFDNAVYIIRSIPAVKNLKGINEMQPPLLFSSQFLFIALLAAGVFVLWKNKILKPWILWLSLGSACLAFQYNRNLWVLYVAACFVAASITSADDERIPVPRLVPVMPVIGLILGFCVAGATNPHLKESEPVTAVKEAMARGEEVILYTSFDAGGRFEYAGIKTFADARLELLTEGICGKPVMEDYFRVDLMGADPKSFIEKYGFNYLATTQNVGYLGYYAYNSPDWELVASGDGINLYRKIR
jgi:hypothetical protein